MLQPNTTILRTTNLKHPRCGLDMVNPAIRRSAFHHFKVAHQDRSTDNQSIGWLYPLQQRTQLMQCSRVVPAGLSLDGNVTGQDAVENHPSSADGILDWRWRYWRCEDLWESVKPERWVLAAMAKGLEEMGDEELFEGFAARRLVRWELGQRAESFLLFALTGVELSLLFGSRFVRYQRCYVSVVNLYGRDRDEEAGDGARTRMSSGAPALGTYWKSFIALWKFVRETDC